MLADCDHKPTGIIYKVTNLINGECYIGQTTQTLNQRRSAHIRLSKKGGYKFHNALNKFDIQLFKWEILCECNNVLELEKLELYYIKLFDCVKNGYNERYSNHSISEGVRQKLSNAQTGHVVSKETKEKMSKSHMGHVASEETKEKQRRSMLGKNKGKYLGENCVFKRLDVREKLSIKQRKYTDNTIKKSIELRNKGMTFKNISNYMNIPLPTIQDWCNKKYRFLTGEFNYVM